MANEATFKRKILAACESIEHKRFASALLNVQAAKKAAHGVRPDHDAGVLKSMLVRWIDTQSGFKSQAEVPDIERIEQEAEFLRAAWG